MTSNRTTPALIALLVTIAAACGTAESATETAANAVNRPVTTTSIASDAFDNAPEAPGVDTAPLAPTEDALASNPNDLTTPMGALCWTRWEIARLQFQTVLAPAQRSDELADIPRDIFTAVADNKSLRQTVEQAMSPASVREFADSLFAKIDERAAGPVASIPIDFETLPGAAAYMEAAAQAPGCKQP